MDNSVDDGLHYYADRLSTSLANGVHTYLLKSPKKTLCHQFLKEGNYITSKQPKCEECLWELRWNVEDNGGNEKTVYCEDAGYHLSKLIC